MCQAWTAITLQHCCDVARPCSTPPTGLDIFGTLPASEDNLAAVEEVCLQVGSAVFKI